MPSNEEVLKSIKILREAGIQVDDPFRQEPTVKIQFVGDPTKNFTVYRSGKILLHAKSDTKKGQTNIAWVTPRKAQQLENDFPEVFRILSGRKDIKEYEDKMVKSYATK